MSKTIFPPAVSWVLLGSGLALGACGVAEDGPPESVEESRILLAEEPAPDAVRSVALDDEGNIVSGDLDLDAMAEDELAGELDLAEEVAQGSTVYFGYDSTEVAPGYMPIIRTAILRLQDNPSARLRLEGHTDERGTRAYNLALGERRAQSVRDIILEQGVLAEQVDLVSYGEELPALTGQGEATWKKNRRVELILEE